MRRQVLPADPLPGVFQWDRLSFLEVLARHDQQFWSLEVPKVPRRMGASGSAVLEEITDESHCPLTSVSRISSVAAVSPSSGKMRSMLLVWATGSVSVIASVASRT